MLVAIGASCCFATGHLAAIYGICKLMDLKNKSAGRDD